MNKKYIFLSLCVAGCVMLAFAGCRKTAQKSAVLASIGSSKITMADFNERIANLPAQYREIIRKRKKEYLDELVNNTLLYQEALRKKVSSEKEVRKVIEEARKKILVARLLKDEIDDVIDIEEEEIVNFYYANQSKYLEPEVFRASHILVFSRSVAKGILSELRKGADFNETAKKRSLDPTAQNGGDIGYFAKGQLMPKFEAASAALEIGEVSNVVKTKLGYHIIKLTDRKSPELKPIDEVTTEIRHTLYVTKHKKLFNELIERLKGKTPISINEKILAESAADVATDGKEK
ncbi:MAG: peptidylprolyl isomerase [Candidatus Omnitrophica bacterium]|nr:peptidylprolyl isomerase [Candidatus Omnitrophota bacterium]